MSALWPGVGLIAWRSCVNLIQPAHTCILSLVYSVVLTQLRLGIVHPSCASLVHRDRDIKEKRLSLRYKAIYYGHDKQVLYIKRIQGVTHVAWSGLARLVWLVTCLMTKHDAWRCDALLFNTKRMHVSSFLVLYITHLRLGDARISLCVVPILRDSAIYSI
jgi:hypothetical protein